jgi:hypothetical protein
MKAFGKLAAREIDAGDGLRQLGSGREKLVAAPPGGEPEANRMIFDHVADLAHQEVADPVAAEIAPMALLARVERP